MVKNGQNRQIWGFWPKPPKWPKTPKLTKIDRFVTEVVARAALAILFLTLG